MPLSALPALVNGQMRGRGVVVREPGIGKTTVLRKLAEECIAETGRDAEALVPLWLHLKDLPSGLSVEAWIKKSLTGMQVPEPNIDQLLANQDLFVFLDGLDNLLDGHPPLRSHPVSWVSIKVSTHTLSGEVGWDDAGPEAWGCP